MVRPAPRVRGEWSRRRDRGGRRAAGCVAGSEGGDDFVPEPLPLFIRQGRLRVGDCPVVGSVLGQLRVDSGGEGGFLLGINQVDGLVAEGAGPSELTVVGDPEVLADLPSENQGRGRFRHPRPVVRGGRRPPRGGEPGPPGQVPWAGRRGSTSRRCGCPSGSSCRSASRPGSRSGIDPSSTPAAWRTGHPA